MKFSVLLPTRNRLELLRYAVESVRRQDFQDWEIVISDNYSSEDVCGYVTSLADVRIRYFRTESFISVTENWNRALANISGDYVVMLGDDDCLLPGYFSSLARLVGEFSEPDCVYCEAIQFAYPGVIKGHEKGFLQKSYSELLDGGQPFLLDKARAKALVRKSMALRFAFSYNMQHSLISRRFIESLAPYGPFFQSSYPDYYASNVILLVAQSILVVPRPLVAIGISPKSFGYYYFNHRPDEGAAFLKNLDHSSIPADIRSQLLPGNSLITFWYLAMVQIERNFGAEHQVRADAGRYRFAKVYMDRRLGLAAIWTNWRHLCWFERIYFFPAIALLHLLRRLRRLGWMKGWADRVYETLSPYPIFEPRIRTVEYNNILDLFEAMLPTR